MIDVDPLSERTMVSPVLKRIWFQSCRQNRTRCRLLVGQDRVFAALTYLDQAKRLKSARSFRAFAIATILGSLAVS